MCGMVSMDVIPDKKKMENIGYQATGYWIVKARGQI